MTKISLFTKDQVLLASQKVKIASGDINSVTLKVAFDEKWDDFTSRVATFDNSNYNETIPDRLLVDNQCVVPWEALSVAGTLSIGIVGDAVDGRKKTSTILKMNILQGAKTGTTTVSPSLDLYQQYIAAMAELCDPVSENIRAEVTKMLKEHTEMVDENTERIEKLLEEHRNLLEGTELWKNPDPTAPFYDFNLEFDRTQYKRLHVESVLGFSTPDYMNPVCWVFSNGNYYISNTSGNMARKIQVSDSGIYFVSPDDPNTYTIENVGDTIPFRVVGYKY